MNMNWDEFFMREAIAEAKKAAGKGEWPIGCVIVLGDKIIARAHNLSLKTSHKLEHAEMIALRESDKVLRENYQQATLYTTCELCPMCLGACLIYKIKRIVAGANPEKSGSFNLLPHLQPYYQQSKFKIETVVGVLEKECLDLFTNYHPKKK